MADIPVKPRRAGTPVWLWAVLALVLIALVWLALTLFNDDEPEVDRTEAVDVGASGVILAAPLALSDFPAHPSLTR